MRGVPVAVLDIKDIDGEEKEELSEKEELAEKGITYWQCDVGDRGQVERTLKAVQEEVRLSFWSAFCGVRGVGLGVDVALVVAQCIPSHSIPVNSSYYFTTTSTD